MPGQGVKHERWLISSIFMKLHTAYTAMKWVPGILKARVGQLDWLPTISTLSNSIMQIISPIYGYFLGWKVVQIPKLQWAGLMVTL